MCSSRNLAVKFERELGGDMVRGLGIISGWDTVLYGVLRLGTSCVFFFSYRISSFFCFWNC